MNITPVWNEEFDKLFMMNFKHVEKCYLELYNFYELSFPSQISGPLKSSKVYSKPQNAKKNTSVKTRNTSSETTNRNSSSTKSSRRSSQIPSILHQNGQKTSSSKKSAVKSFRPESSQTRAANPVGLLNSSSSKKVQTPGMEYRKTIAAKGKIP